MHCLKNIVEGLKEKDVIEVKPIHYKMKHPTEKPVELMERLINLVSNQEHTILDCFMGSGSTGVACINTNRNFIGIELDKKYFDIAKERIENASFFTENNNERK